VSGGPFVAVLGAKLAQLPAPVRSFHAATSPFVATGRADVAQAGSLAARLLCMLARLPRSGSDVRVGVAVTPLPGGRERWVRRFASRTYASTMTAGSGADAGLLIERFGPFGVFHLLFRLEPAERGLAWQLAGWKLLGVRLPDASAPRIDCLESAEAGRFRFDIDVAFPLIGPVLTYSGTLVPEPAGGWDG